MSADQTCIVCNDAPGVLTAYVENPTTGARLTFPCCWECLRANATPEGNKRITAAANRYAAELAAKTGGLS